MLKANNKDTISGVLLVRFTNISACNYHQLFECTKDMVKNVPHVQNKMWQ